MLRFSGLSPEMATHFAERPLVLFRAVATPNREMMRFLRLAKIVGRPPLVATIPQDRFTPAPNPSKRRLAKLPVENSHNGMRHATIAQFQKMDGLRFTEMHCLDETPFLDLHCELMQIAIGPLHLPATLDLTGFWGDRGAHEYYRRFLALFTCFGVLADSPANYGYERSFTEDVIQPAIEQVTARFGKPPRIVRLLPPGEELDAEWEYYPNAVMERAMRATRRPLQNAASER